jgi:hypothetical protein
MSLGTAIALARPFSVVAALAVVVALSLTAIPRRTGDAQQYLAMAMQLSHARPPSLDAGTAAQYLAWLEAQPAASGFPDGARAVRQPALIRDGRQEFSHFWLYPLLTVPAMVVTDTLGAHPLVAFILTNAVLLVMALSFVARVFGLPSALLLLASPLVWFVARAQVEVFTLSLLCLAMAAAATGRWGWGALAVAVASTQNLPIAATIPLFWVGALAHWIADWKPSGQTVRPQRMDTRRALVFGAASLVIPLLHPAYYLWRLGVVTPQQLNGGIQSGSPSWGRYLAILIDPDIGLLWWVPATSLIVFVGGLILVRSLLRRRVGDRGTASPAFPPSDRQLAAACLVALAMAVWFLFVFSQTSNVNSGGTVFMSRYGLWLLPLALPAVAAGTRRLDRQTPGLATMAALALFGVYLLLFRPDQPERYTDHSPQAAWLMTHLPALYRPLPEVFVERTRHIDGGPRLSAADPACRLIFLLASAPDQPCSLTLPELSAAQAQFGRGVTGIWIRRDVTGPGDVTTALPER